VRNILQLTPELAAEIAGFQLVMFIDADVTCSEPEIAPVSRDPIDRTPLSHAMYVFETLAWPN
jgi:hypothetical protein